ncbi:hypothetical protein [Klebsiella quasipneumoniae]|uniref:hypothetical protein n=1 Tax=Klebsiella quasipneumoniae TaxID=1463165 RepID=UPI000C79D6FF|nr:hypothetical protein [Klebsiella quasipneumoniae]PLJ70232.1 hypothetical protein B6J71_18500 [Klebsiella quasipneumoniae]
MNIETVNELIASLESAGELPIRERKYLELAKEFRICSISLDAVIRTGNALADKNAQLAAENMAAKKIISECREYFNAGVMNRIRPTNEGYLHMICDTFADETPATDRIVAGIKADGVEEFVSNTVHKIFDGSEAVSALSYLSLANAYVKQLREGADK